MHPSSRRDILVESVREFGNVVTADDGQILIMVEDAIVVVSLTGDAKVVISAPEQITSRVMMVLYCVKLNNSLNEAVFGSIDYSPSEDELRELRQNSENDGGY